MGLPCGFDLVECEVHGANGDVAVSSDIADWLSARDEHSEATCVLRSDFDQVAARAFAEQGCLVGHKFEFQAEVGRVMDLIINSLYSDKDIFLRGEL